MQRLTKSQARVKKYGEVYTPDWVVKQMCDMLPESEAWTRIDTTFLEPSCGNGNFLVEIFRRKLILCKTPEDGLIALNSMVGIDILPDNCEESRERLRRMFFDRFKVPGAEIAMDVDQILERNIICGNSLEIMKQWSEEE